MAKADNSVRNCFLANRFRRFASHAETRDRPEELFLTFVPFLAKTFSMEVELPSLLIAPPVLIPEDEEDKEEKDPWLNPPEEE